ncbi:hypothetical protein, partial [Oceanicella sp. SM1341]|uniref:hypothetical protein n=1 Tax=Oceanicella sp. SM1341 TaxID=1548889 RepID=UPI000E51C33B
ATIRGGAVVPPAPPRAEPLPPAEAAAPDAIAAEDAADGEDPSAPETPAAEAPHRDPAAAAALSRMEASAARFAGGQAAPLSSSSARVREDIRAALSRMEGGARERSRDEPPASDEDAEARSARAEMRRTLAGMQDVASATAADAALPGENRAAAAQDGARIAAALEALDSTPLGPVAEERARLADTLARLEAEQAPAEEASPAAAAVLSAGNPPGPEDEPDPVAEAVMAEAATSEADKVEDYPDEEQATLPLTADGGEEEAEAGVDWTEMLIALNFPMDEADSEGFTAMKQAMRDHQMSQCLRAAEDVLTLLSQDGIYMDDLIPDPAPAALWQAFARGTRGPSIAGLGAIRDEEALASSRERSRRDPIFRDATLHFLRRFDVVLRRMCAEAREDEISALSSTRTGRAFMLLARVHGAFD